MNFLSWLKREKPAYTTFGGQIIMDLFDDERVKNVIELEPGFAKQKKDAILRKLGADEKDVEECMGFIRDPKGDAVLTGTLRECSVWIQIVPGGYNLSMDNVKIDDNFPEKKEIIDFVNGVRKAVNDEVESVHKLQAVVKMAKDARAREELEQKKKEQEKERIQKKIRAFFNRR